MPRPVPSSVPHRISRPEFQAPWTRPPPGLGFYVAHLRLLGLLEDRHNPGKPISAEGFQRILDCAPEEDVDEETAAELREALREGGPSLTLDQVKRELGIA